MERANDPEAKFDVVTFDFASGAKIRVRIDEFWEQLSEADLRKGHRPNLYLAIRVYSDEDTTPRRLVTHTEFRAGIDFDQSCIPRLTTWLADLAMSRHRFAYDRVEDFLEEFAARMDEFSAVGEDVADRLHKKHWIEGPPPYEDPPHAEFPEDEFRSIQEKDRLGASDESDDDDPGDGDNAGPSYSIKDQTEEDLSDPS